jgi:acetate kinase
VRVLVVNCGSATLKWEVRDVAAGSSRLAGGQAPSVAAMLAALPGGVEAAGHRIVHGGARFTAPTVLDGGTLAALEEVSRLAPLHNGPALAAVREVAAAIGPAVPQVGVFDTAFHAALPEPARTYALPADLAARHGIRRFGFHGLAHRSMAEQWAVAAGRPLAAARLVTLQLGGGASACAVHGGRSVDTSMGFTPLEGLVMGTRSGDLDPALVGFLARAEDVGVEEVERRLNHESGLLGLSGRSRDMADLLAEASAGDRRAALAVDVFCHRATKYVGAYLAVLGGADAVVFGGGIGERAPAVRARICGALAFAGLDLDPDANDAAVGTLAPISRPGSRLAAWVVPVDEGAIIAAEVAALLSPPPTWRGSTGPTPVR